MRSVPLKSLINTLIGLLLLLNVASVSGEEVVGLYAVELPVESQRADERQAKTVAGFKIVLRRVSGHPSVHDHRLVREALSRPDRYIRQYSYVAGPKSDGNGQEAQLLHLQFDQTQIDRLLRKAQLPIWGSNRPQLLLWLTIDEGTGRQIIASGQDSEQIAEIYRHARRRGIPLILPLMDLQDDLALSVEDAWGLFRQPLEYASQRYQPEAILAGRLFRDMEQVWHGRWRFIFNREVTGFNTRSDNQQDDLGSVIDYVADLLARHYAVKTDANSQEKLAMKVEGVSTLKAYAAVTGYLQKLAAITRVTIVGVDKDSLRLELTAEDSVEKLREAIALDNKLVEIEVEKEAEFPVLKYRWQTLE